MPTTGLITSHLSLGAEANCLLRAQSMTFSEYKALI